MKYLLPPILFIIFIVSMILLHLFLPIGIYIVGSYKLYGIALILMGRWTTFNGAKIFKRKGTTEMTFDEPELLVTEGIYNVTRNPMYLGFTLMLLGFAWVLGSISPFIMVLSFVVITDLWYIRFEERMLEKKFGEAYLDYKNSVSRWI